MPQIEKFGYASATTTVTSTLGSSSRARSAALMPASLPPMTTRCIARSPISSGVGRAVSERTSVRDDDVVGRHAGVGIKQNNEASAYRSATKLSENERRR